jgi:hypothetical protein
MKDIPYQQSAKPQPIPCCASGRPDARECHSKHWPIFLYASQKCAENEKCRLSECAQLNDYTTTEIAILLSKSLHSETCAAKAEQSQNTNND